jgi:NitT/TauT family transport system substrate-binding protein
MTRISAIALALCALALPASAQQKNDVVTVAQTLSLAQAPYYVALAKNYFAAEQIDVDADPQRGAQDTVAMLATGKLDISIGAISAGFYNAQNQGLDLRVVAALGIQPSPVVATPSVARKDLWDSGAIKSGKDFKGRKVAINVPGAIPEYFLYLILTKYGMTMKDVDETILGFPQMVVALKNQALDVGIMPDPFAATAIRDGVGAVVTPENTIGAGEITTMVFFSGQFMRQRPEVGTRFLRALLRAARETQGAYNKNPDLVQALAKGTNLKPEAVEDSTPAYFDPNLDVSKYEDSIRRQEEVYIKIGRLNYLVPLPMDKMVDATLVHAAAAGMK